MGLWTSVYRRIQPDGSATPVTAIELRLKGRREGLKDAVAEHASLQETDGDLMRRITAIDAALDIADASDVTNLRQQLEELRQARGPVATRLAELASSIPARERLIAEDERELERALYAERETEHMGRVAAEAEERKQYLDRLQAALDSLKSLASYQAAIEAGQNWLTQEAKRLGVEHPHWKWWSAPTTLSESTEAMARAYNAGLNQQLRVITAPEPDDPKARAQEIVEALRVPEREHAWITAEDSANGRHTWESTPLPAGSAETCRYRDHCQEPAVAQLSYRPPVDKPRIWPGCSKHAGEFEQQYRRQARPAGVA